MPFPSNSQAMHSNGGATPHLNSSLFDQAAIAFSNSLATMGAAAYINGLEIPDAALEAVLAASAQIDYKFFSNLLVPYDWLSQESDRLAEDPQHLMQIQYNLPSMLFQLMLEEGTLLYPKYSMALWEKGVTNLAQAQLRMLDDAIEKLGIEDGDEILDLGCGWGSASNYLLAKFPHARVTAVNLSHEQCEYIRQKMQTPESCLNCDRFTLLEADFNEVQFEAKFDKIITIGVFEHIGNLTGACRKLAENLNEQGKVLIHIISTQLPCNITHRFIDQYIFPNMRVWNYDVLPQIDRDLTTIDRWYINGTHYAQTLRAWLRNFDNHQAQLQGLSYGANYQQFRRMWRLYLLLCIHHFEAGSGDVLGNAQYLLVHA